MATMHSIYKDGKPFSSHFTNLRRPDKVIASWRQRWQFSHNQQPPEGEYTTKPQLETCLDNYGVKRKG